MSRSLAEHGVTWTEDGAPDGWQVGKAAALLDWQHKREKEKFAKLCESLRVRRWYLANRERAKAANRARYLANRTERLAADKARYEAKCGPKPIHTCQREGCGKRFPSRRRVAKWCSNRCRSIARSARHRAKVRAARPPKPPKLSAPERRLRDAPPLVCEHCGKSWRLTRIGQKRARFCSNTCRDRAKYLRSPRGRSVQRRHTGAVTRALLGAVAGAWTTHCEVRERTGLGKNTVAGTLAKLVEAGKVESRWTKRGRRPIRQYRSAA